MFRPPLRILSLFFSLSVSVSILFSVHGFKAIRAHGCLIPLPLPVGSPATASLGVPCSASSSGSQGVATCPPAAAPIRFIGSVFPLCRGMSLFPPWQSNRMSSLYKLRLNPPSIPLSHRAQSQSLDLGPPDLTPYARFARLTCSTVSAQSTTVFSLLCLPRVGR